MIIIPEYDIVAVFTGWNVYEIPSLHSYKAMQKVINAVVPEKPNNTKIVILCLYFLVLLGIGFTASKRIHNISDYYVGGKNLAIGSQRFLLDQPENQAGFSLVLREWVL